MHDLVQDENVDIVYIATPHNLPYEQMIEALQAGKHVFCEKPLLSALNSLKKQWRSQRKKSCHLRRCNLVPYAALQTA